MSVPVVYRSTDASAPVLSGQVGGLTALLDACLVNGYGSQVAAGWTNASVGTDHKTYTQGGGNGFEIDVNDDAAGTGGAQEALCRGVGASQFPTTTQLTAGIVARKSATADATARVWVLIADDRTFYLFVQTGDSAGVYLAMGFGDVFSLLTGDVGRTILIGRATQNSATATVDNLDLLAAPSTVIGAMTGHYIATSFTGTGGSLQCAKHGDGNMASGTSSVAMAGHMSYPNPTDGGLYISRVYVVEPSGSVRRGYLRGLYHWVHPTAGVIDGDTFEGTPGSEFDGREFLVVKSSGSGGLYVMETTNWDTSS